jgi:hypothetical protein
MSAQDTERAAALERRYRRLLRCYPPGHRQVHREEMLGVLLATARPGQRAPGAKQTVNLVACGLAIRVRRALRSLADESWQDALAVVSLIIPVLMLIISALGFAVAIREAVVEHHAYPPAAAGPFWQPWLVPFLGGPAVAMIGWLAVVLLGLTGRRRAAAAIASIALALAQACLMIAGLSVVFGFTEVVYLVRPSVSLAGFAFSFLGVLTLAVTVVITRVRGTVGWRVSALVAGPALLLDAVAIPFAGSSTASVVLSLASLLFAVLVWPVAIASWRGRVRRSSNALPA